VKNILVDLKNKNNKTINHEIDRIYTKTFSDNPIIVKNENKTLCDKVEQLDKKYEILIRENKNLKILLEDRTKKFKNISSQLDTFKRQLDAMRDSQRKDNNVSVSYNKKVRRKNTEELLKMGMLD
jgi:hypothetical protein